MSYSKAIWNEVTSCKYKSSKSFGAFNDCKIKTYTGSSSSNSELLCDFEIMKKVYEEIIVFNAYFDSELMSQTIFHRKKNSETAGEFIEKIKQNFVNRSNEVEYLKNKK
ncbi:hypothetical protein UFOVP597_40 [uncultured Caudovirales phage]|uniref:Uncharacterized protein n=1 Tax=uncultured Caudovirales phage TaxID=2100421 RepID=A0A6J5MZC2_9CAUD|nr:hypothetical protein UFOVP597_40 [uncultured Caudovirales phage]